MKRDSSLLFQSLLSLALIAFAGGLVTIGLLASARLSQQTKEEPSEASRNLVSTDDAEWNQFYDAVARSERTAEVAQPADVVPEKRAAGDVVDFVKVPTATGMLEDQAPSTATLPVTSHSASSELAVKTEAPSVQAAAPPDHPHEDGAPVAKEPIWDREPQGTAPSIAASESASPAIATAPVPPLNVNAGKSTQK